MKAGETKILTGRTGMKATAEAVTTTMTATREVQVMEAATEITEVVTAADLRRVTGTMEATVVTAIQKAHGTLIAETAIVITTATVIEAIAEAMMITNHAAAEAASMNMMMIHNMANRREVMVTAKREEEIANHVTRAVAAGQVIRIATLTGNIKEVILDF